MWTKVASHPGVRWISLGWAGFIAENLVLSHNRGAIIESIGEDNYHRSYSALSTVACSSIAYGYFRHGRAQGPRLVRPLWAGLGSLTLQGLGLVGFSQLAPRLQAPFVHQAPTAPTLSSTGLGAAEDGAAASPASAPGAWRPRCPIDFTPTDEPQDGVYGLKRITRHGMFWSLGLFGLGSALTTVYITEIIFFSAPAVFAAIGGAHQDYRFRHGIGGTLPDDVYNSTSLIPFGALLTGHQRWTDVFRELKDVNAAGAVILALILAFRRLPRGVIPQAVPLR